ncbi:ECF subfamily RNA polymerase sigma-24 factor [Alcanivorax sp. 521-1]|uniref:ECF subfamily RNA polymerase sigma-24 factor n=1 Tax=Alloalcanivorax profundimaris TaxID=2735259 RepID=A0ABS0ALW4_9GAMM|nr:sigma-70 family RNA polymerase sigma factor [Alloalcanivorax profundimaris]MBF5055124.1 ECF subfamily RNA polymerase sigma-24 factor [Alloalcanivorax profundimaris]MBM1145793.1 sigma-70 family RNA polymerase sigma factor [Alcanivorax sp. ZXX171]
MTVASHSDVQTLYTDHGGWLRALLYRRLGCPDTAADLSQDVFVRLLLKPAGTSPREPRAFLARIAHGLVVDHHRRRAVEQAWRDTLAALPADHQPSPEAHWEIVDALARLDALLEHLRPRARTVFLLAKLDGLTYPAIAERLSVSLSTVEKDMALALRHCYRVLMGG